MLPDGEEQDFVAGPENPNPTLADRLLSLDQLLATGLPGVAQSYPAARRDLILKYGTPEEQAKLLGEPVEEPHPPAPSPPKPAKPAAKRTPRVKRKGEQ